MTNSNGRLAGDDGAVLVEFGLIAPFMVLIVLGIFEFGTAWRNSTIIGASLRTSVRATVQAQNTATADMLGLQALTAGMAQTRNVTIEKVIVYKVFDTNTTGTVPSGCTTASTSGTPPFGVNTSTVKCNVYVPSQLTTANLVAANFGCAAGDYDVNYCPTTRSATLAGTGPDKVGVWMQVKYDTVTKLLPGDITIRDSTTSQIEPNAA